MRATSGSTLARKILSAARAACRTGQCAKTAGRWGLRLRRWISVRPPGRRGDGVIWARRREGWAACSIMFRSSALTWPPARPSTTPSSRRSAASGCWTSARSSGTACCPARTSGSALSPPGTGSASRTSPSRRPTAPRCGPSSRPRPPAAPRPCTRRGCGRSITTATTAPSSATPTATTSRPSATGPSKTRLSARARRRPAPGETPSPGEAPASGLALDVLVRELRRGGRQPAVRDRVPERLPGDLAQLDEHGGIPVEVRDREEGLRLRGEHRLLLAEILDADGEDRPLRRGLVAEPPEIGFAERALPRECLACDEPGPVAVTLTLGDLGQARGHQGHVVETRHTGTVAASRRAGQRWLGRTGLRLGVDRVEHSGGDQVVPGEHRQPVVHPFGVGEVGPVPEQPGRVGERKTALRLVDLQGGRPAGGNGPAFPPGRSTRSSAAPRQPGTGPPPRPRLPARARPRRRGTGWRDRARGTWRPAGGGFRGYRHARCRCTRRRPRRRRAAAPAR